MGTESTSTSSGNCSATCGHEMKKMIVHLNKARIQAKSLQGRCLALNVSRVNQRATAYLLKTVVIDEVACLSDLILPLDVLRGGVYQ